LKTEFEIQYSFNTFNTSWEPWQTPPEHTTNALQIYSRTKHYWSFKRNGKHTATCLNG